MVAHLRSAGPIVDPNFTPVLDIPRIPPKKHRPVRVNYQANKNTQGYISKHETLAQWTIIQWAHIEPSERGNMQPMIEQNKHKYDSLKGAIRNWLDQEQEEYTAYVWEYVNMMFEFASQTSIIELGTSTMGPQELLNLCHEERIYHKFFKFDRIIIPKDAQEYISAFFKGMMSHSEAIEELSQRDISSPSQAPVVRKDSKKALDELLAKLDDGKDVRSMSHDELDYLQRRFPAILDAVRDAQGAVLTFNVRILLQAVWNSAYELFKAQPNFLQEHHSDAKALEGRKELIIHYANRKKMLRKYYSMKDELRLDGDAHCIHRFCTTALTYRAFQRDLSVCVPENIKPGKRKRASSPHASFKRVCESVDTETDNNLITPPPSPHMRAQHSATSEASEASDGRENSDKVSSDNGDIDFIETEAPAATEAPEAPEAQNSTIRSIPSLSEDQALGGGASAITPTETSDLQSRQSEQVAKLLEQRSFCKLIIKHVRVWHCHIHLDDTLYLECVWDEAKYIEEVLRDLAEEPEFKHVKKMARFISDPENKFENLSAKITYILGYLNIVEGLTETTDEIRKVLETLYFTAEKQSKKVQTFLIIPSFITPSKEKSLAP
jgi:hypothetical protein